jgi:hypothetical protein
LNQIYNGTMRKCVADFSLASEILVRSFVDRIKGNLDSSGLLAAKDAELGSLTVIITISEGHQHYIDNIANVYGGCRNSNWKSK